MMQCLYARLPSLSYWPPHMIMFDTSSSNIIFAASRLITGIISAGVVGTGFGDRDGGGESGLSHVVRGCRWHWVW